jgi:hypothetical protein
MRAMTSAISERSRPCATSPSPLAAVSLPDPVPGAGEILIRVAAAGAATPSWTRSKADAAAAPAGDPRTPGGRRVEALGPGVALRPASGGARRPRRGVVDHFRLRRVLFLPRRPREPLPRLPRHRARRGRRLRGADDHPGRIRDPYPRTGSATSMPRRSCAPERHRVALAAPVGATRRGSRLGLTGFGASAHLVLQHVLAADPDGAGLRLRASARRSGASHWRSEPSGRGTRSTPLRSRSTPSSTPRRPGPPIV